ncbi:hypothetical protein VTI28DRAFT_10053 [Corynascus sepedonium]
MTVQVNVYLTYTSFVYVCSTSLRDLGNIASNPLQGHGGSFHALRLSAGAWDLLRDNWPAFLHGECYFKGKHSKNAGDFELVGPRKPGFNAVGCPKTAALDAME